MSGTYRDRLAALVMLLLVCFFTGCAQTRYKLSHIHPVCGKPYEECPVDLSAYKSAQQRIGSQDHALALAVAISGGGHRAANFGAGALLELEQITSPDLTKGNVLSQIDYFSTVSGGGFAAAAYISSLHDHLTFDGTCDDYSFAKALRYPSHLYPSVRCPPNSLPPEGQTTDPCIRRALQGFYPEIIKNLIQDIISWLTLDMFNNAGYFEKILDDDILGYRWRKRKLRSLQSGAEEDVTLTLGDIFVPQDDLHTDVTLPYWAANAAVYENGSIFPFTPAHLILYRITGYRHRLEKYTYIKSRQDYDRFIRGVPLSVGVTASANFPVATFPTMLSNAMDPNNPYLYLLDGGLADNIGVITAVRLLDAEYDPGVTTKALIVIDAYQGEFAPFSNTKHPPPIGNTARRIMDISLDSWRGRYREILRSLCEEKNVGVVFISFDDLADLTDCQPLFEFGLDPNDLNALTRKRHSPSAPFDLLRAIPTLKIEEQGRLSPAEQNLLFAAGRYVVHKNKTGILNALNW